MGRIRNAWGALFDDDAPRVKAAGGLGDAGSALVSGVIRGSSPPTRGMAGMLKAYTASPWFRAVTDRIATSVASTEWKLVRGARSGTRDILTGVRGDPETRAYELQAMRRTGEISDVEVHPLLDLLAKPHPQFSQYTLFALTQLYLDIIGDSFWLIERGTGKRPSELWPIPPTWVRALPTPDSPFFEVRERDWRPDPIAEDDMVWARVPNPENPYGRGSGTGYTLNDEIDADEFAAKTVAARFYNFATPDLLISLSQQDPNDEEVTKEEAERFKQKWMNEQRGYARAGLPKFTNRKIDVQQLSYDFASMQLVDLRQFERDAIIQTFGVPPEIVGIVENSNRASITAASFIFARWVLTPRLDLLEAQLNNALVDQFGDPSLMLVYESPIPEDREHKTTVMQAAPQGTFTEEEWREFAGFAPKSADEETPDDDSDDPAEPDGDEGPEDADPADPEDGGEEAPAASARATATRLRTLCSPEKFTAIPRPAPGAVTWPAMAGGGVLYDGAIAATFDGHDPEILTDLEHLCCGLDPHKIITCDDVFNDPRVEAVVNELRADRLITEVEPIWEAEMEVWMKRTLDKLGANISFDILNPLIKRHLVEFAGDRIVGLVNEITRQHIRNQLIEGVQRGEDIRRLAKRVEATFDDADRVRATRIARTEVLRSSNYATFEAHRISGLVDKREWVGTPDGRVRPEHDPAKQSSGSLDGQIKGINQPFVVMLASSKYKGSTGMYPGGFGVPALDIQCRCTTSALALGDDAAVRTPAERSELHRVFEKEREPWEKRARSGFRTGFKKQERDVLRLLRQLFKGGA